MNDWQKLEEIKRLATEIQENLSPPSMIPIPTEELQIGYKPNNWILWKPESEHGGNVVLLLPGSWPQPTKVEVLDDNDNWERFDYSGVANGDRFHFRGNRPGQGYRGDKNGGEIRVYWDSSYGVIKFIDKPRNRQGN